MTSTSNFDILFYNIYLKDVIYSIPFKIPGYVNATSICTTFGKRIRKWKKHTNTKKAIIELSLKNGIPVDKLMYNYTQGNYTNVLGLHTNNPQGTYIHPDLVCEFKNWVDDSVIEQVQNICKELSNDYKSQGLPNKELVDLKKENLDMSNIIDEFKNDVLDTFLKTNEEKWESIYLLAPDSDGCSKIGHDLSIDEEPNIIHRCVVHDSDITVKMLLDSLEKFKIPDDNDTEDIIHNFNNIKAGKYYLPTNIIIEIMNDVANTTDKFHDRLRQCYKKNFTKVNHSLKTKHLIK